MDYLGSRIHPAWGETFHPVELQTTRGAVAARWTKAVTPTGCAVLCVGGIGGGWDSPAKGLYPTLLPRLAARGIAGMRVRFRHPRMLDEAVFDALAGLAFLNEQGILRCVLIGHSLGGAVVIQAAARTPLCAGLVLLASQAHGTAVAERLSVPALILHGRADTILPVGCSELVHDLLRGPRQMNVYQDGGHSLDEVASDIHQTVEEWVVATLSPAS